MQTGMEMAAETKEAGVDAVTLVHGKDFITNTPEQGKIPLQRLKKIGVKVKLNTRAEQTEGKTYRIDGETQTFDVVFKCVGFNPVHSHLITGLGDVLTPTGAIDVNESFQVCFPGCCGLCAMLSCMNSFVFCFLLPIMMHASDFTHSPCTV